MPEPVRGQLRHASLPDSLITIFRKDAEFPDVQADGRHMVRIGHSREQEDIAIDVATGEVVLVDGGSVAGVVNTDLDSFVRSLEFVAGHLPFYSEEDDFEEAEEAARQLADGLAAIDSRSADEGSYWADFLSDVADGDYPGEDDE